MGQYYRYEFPVGAVGIAEENGEICRVFFMNRKGEHVEQWEKVETPLIARAAAQLTEYFEGRRISFDLPLAALRGTPFQCAVWRALAGIPYGETRYYEQVAALAGSPKACRAAGLANNRNPVAIIIPCHRVVGKNGGLTGFGGGLPAKQYLLDLEKRVLSQTVSGATIRRAGF